MPSEYWMIQLFRPAVNQFRQETPVRVIVSVKADVGILGRVVVREIAAFAAEKHPGA